MPTILVADDNSNIQKMVSLVFKERGIRVVAVGNGEAACRKVPEVHPDLVLADVFMPVRNGYEVCEFVKQDPQFAETPVILLVGAFDPLDEKEAQRVGANGVLKKPFVPPEPLVDLVSSLLKMDSPDTAPQAVEGAPAPPPARVISAPSVREVPRTALSSESNDAEEIAPSFREPVATPAAKANNVEEADEDSDPGSEWARRRATMDYEIDASESANMVERLAAGNAAEEAEVLPSNKHVPFAGANVSEMPLDAAPAPPVSWPDLIVPKVAAEPSAELSRQRAAVEENSAVNTELSDSASLEKVSQTGLENRGIGEFSAPSPALEEAPLQEEPANAYGGLVLKSSELPNDVTLESSSQGWSSPEAPQQDESIVADSEDVEPAEQEDSHATSPYGGAPPVWPNAVKQTVEPPSVVHATTHVPIGNTNESAAHSQVEAPADEALPTAPVDPATVDDVVARVISRLEPQLHQALANGVLRPLVEEVLNQQRREKK